MTARVALLTVALLVGAAHEATAADPWQLRCPSMPREQPSPTALRPAVLRFYPWVRPAARSLEAGPIYLVALSSNTAISRDGDDTDGARYYLHRALIAVAPSYAGSVKVSGRRLGRAVARATRRVLTGRRHALQLPQGGRDLWQPPAHVHHDPPDRSSPRLADRSDRAPHRAHGLLRAHRDRRRAARDDSARRAGAGLRLGRLVADGQFRTRMAATRVATFPAMSYARIVSV